jgi:hypothetical protein
MRQRMARTAFIIALCLAPLATGCHTGRNDLLEAELRTRERELYELKGQLDQAQIVNDALERELISRHVPGAAVPHEAPCPVPAGLKDIIIGRGTGGLDQDGVPGDEALLVVVTPRDEDESPVKAVGTLRVQALEVTSEGTKFPLSVWEVPALQLRRTWRAALFSTGFHVTLPWKRFPTSERVRLVVQLALPDGRVFEADRDIAVRPPVSVPRPRDLPIPPIAPAPEMILPQPEGPALSRLRPAELGWPRAAARNQVASP